MYGGDGRVRVREYVRRPQMGALALHILGDNDAYNDDDDDS